jgi:monoamine oxidase
VEPQIKTRGLSLVEGYHAADPGRISVQALIRNTAADERPGAERQFRFAEGYDGLVAAIVHGIDAERCEIRLETVVVEVAWQRNDVRIRSATGAELTAPRALVTVPLGVLQAGTIRFTPRLDAKDHALRTLEMGAVVRASLCFGNDVWAAQDAFSADGFLFIGAPPFPAWWVSNRPPAPVLTGWAAGPNARRLAGLTEAERVGVALESLAPVMGVDPTKLRGALHGGFSHDWQADPFSRGAYSYAAVGGSASGDELGLPLDDTLFFAGEATESDGRNATVHGAIASAHRAATALLRG